MADPDDAEILFGGTLFHLIKRFSPAYHLPHANLVSSSSQGIKCVQGGVMEFDRRVALVTGGTGAFGSSVALDLLGSGACVVVTHLSDKE
jgi:3-oxoacyl-ACP reductase-like protein